MHKPSRSCFNAISVERGLIIHRIVFESSGIWGLRYCLLNEFFGRTAFHFLGTLRIYFSQVLMSRTIRVHSYYSCQLSNNHFVVIIVVVVSVYRWCRRRAIWMHSISYLSVKVFWWLKHFTFSKYIAEFTKFAFRVRKNYPERKMRAHYKSAKNTSFWGFNFAQPKTKNTNSFLKVCSLVTIFERKHDFCRQDLIFWISH